ncbi:MAG: tRNA pseudouridine(55) synthase TruB [Bacteroidales bacterium]|nr:tRNA pseudouridine(55) synthase TruB [Bacteroidales bacterium]
MLTADDIAAGVVLAVDKPRGWTSFQAVNKVKAAVRNNLGLKKFKIGHAGTLDPLATGVLLVCMGKATKRIAELQEGTKVYSGTLVLGATTPCYDLERAIDQYYPYLHIDEAMVRQTAQRFVGEIEQVPPIFSAVKIAGQRAYTYARVDDPTATIEPKKVSVYNFDITAFRPGSLPVEEPQTNPSAHQGQAQTHLYNNPQGSVPAHLPQVDFCITCGKGTYIRSLARDLGVALGSGAFVSALRRERVGEYTASNAIRLADIDKFITF